MPRYRITFLVTLALGLLVASLLAEAQPGGQSIVLQIKLIKSV